MALTVPENNIFNHIIDGDMLERRSKAWYVGILNGFLADVFNFRWHDEKVPHDPQIS